MRIFFKETTCIVPPGSWESSYSQLGGAAKIVMRRPVASIPSKRMNVFYYCYYYGLVILSKRKWPYTSRRSNSRTADVMDGAVVACKNVITDTLYVVMRNLRTASKVQSVDP